MVQLFARVGKNASFSLMAQVVSRLSVTVYLLVLGRQLSQADFGFYNFCFSLALILTSLSNLGLETMIVREIVRYRERAGSYFGSALAFKALLSLAVLALLAALGWMLGWSGERQTALFLLGLGLVLRDLVELLFGIIRAYQRMEWEVLFSFVEGALLLVLLGLAVWGHGGFLGMLSAFALTYAAESLLVFGVVFFRFLRPRFSRQIRKDLELLRISAPVGLANLAGVLNNNSGTLLLPALYNEAENGLYSAAFSLVKAFLLLPRSLGIAVLPVFSDIYAHSRETLQHTFERVMRLAFIGILPLSLACWFYARPIIVLLYQERYAAAAGPLRILSLGFAVLLLNTLALNLMYAADQQKLAGAARTASIIAQLGLLLWLAPLAGGVGAALALFLANLLLLIVALYAIGRWVCPYNWQSIFIRPALAGAAAAAAFLLVGRWSPWVAAPLALAAYGGGLVLFRAIGVEERELLSLVASRLRRRRVSSSPLSEQEIS